VAPVVEAPAPVAPAAPERPALTLVGTIIGQGSDKIAIFFNANSRSVIRLHLGESDSGWVLRSVGAREIVLEKNGQTVMLALPAPGDAPAQPPPGTDEQL
jgi:general secretion pathway protein N